MAKKETLLGIAVDADHLEYDVDVDSPKTSHQKKLEDLLEQLSASEDIATITLFRQSVAGHSSRMVFLDAFPIDKYTFDGLHIYIRDAFGSGDYRIQVRVSGRAGLVGNSLLQIEAPQKSDQESTQMMDSTAHSLERLEKIEKAILTMNANANAQPKPAPENEEQWLAKMTRYKELFSGNAQEARSPVAMFHELMELQALIRPAEGVPADTDTGSDTGTDSFTSLIEAASPVLMRALERVGDNQSQSASANRIPNARDNAALRLQSFMGLLLRGAATQNDPELYIELIVSELPSEVIHRLAAMDMTEVISHYPQIQQHTEWFQEFLAALKAFVAEIDAEASEPMAASEGIAGAEKAQEPIAADSESDVPVEPNSGT